MTCTNTTGCHNDISNQQDAAKFALLILLTLLYIIYYISTVNTQHMQRPDVLLQLGYTQWRTQEFFFGGGVQ